MADPQEAQRLRAEIRVLQEELEQARVLIEDAAQQAVIAADDHRRLHEELGSLQRRHRLAENSIGDLRSRLSKVMGAEEAQRATRGAAEEELHVVVEELEVLAEELERTNAELRTLNAELDQRVAHRTRELALANQAFSDREQRLSLAMRHAGACSWDWELATNRLFWSDEHADLYGRPLSTLTLWLDAILDDDRPGVEFSIRACANGDTGEMACEYRILHPLKGLRWLSSRGRLITDTQGRGAYLSGLSSDITDRKSAEEDLRRANEELSARIAEAVAARDAVQAQLFQKQKLEALGQLTGGVAHDFNNLLAVISNGLQLSQSVDDPIKRGDLIDRMLAAVDRGSVLTRRLLTFGRRQPLRPEYLMLDAFLAEFLELVRPSLRKDINVIGRTEPGLWPVRVDPGELQLALLNLCINSRDAMPGKGRIELSLGNRPTDEGDFVEISVTDNGSGMAPDVVSRIFEPFFTTKDVGQGTGLGLAQVYGFITQSGGTVSVASQVGDGTTFTLQLPRTPEQADAGTVVTPLASPVILDGLIRASILMVEDDDELGPMVEQMLQHVYRVTRVGTARAALEALQREDAVFDLVLTDLRLPAGLDGLSLAKLIFDRYPKIPVVITTGFSGALVAEAVQRGLPVLRKPYRFDELTAVVGLALRGVVH